MSLAKPDRETIERWNRILEPYLGADTRRSVTQILTSVIPFAVLWYLAYLSLSVSYWLTLLLVIPTSGFLIRMFIIQHDCGHGSFFKSRTARDWVGRCIGVLLLTPYDYWKRTHAYHHAHSGDLDFRGFGDVDTYTVAEYLSWPKSKRIRYRLYRHPLVLFGVAPFYQFFIKHRFPADIPRRWKTAWRSVWWTNLAIVGVVALMWATIGIKNFLLVQVPVTMLASTIGVWMFYVQHQYEDTYWHWHEKWDYYDASLYGSSYLVLPKALQWLSGNIGVHHVHHMSARIPNYKLQQVHDENPEFHVVAKVRFRDTLKLINLALWDEENRRLIRFRDLKARRAA
ncbi:MAG: fatty acid desaturase [Gemmatimonadota bacterium]|nr:fatty acid desaturase [Gemmatimonadota bacterium]MDH3422171.1 fatty acid desaturase [Gemmatimonadota bacterium]